jgi:DNA-binding protein HU-beta
MNKTELIDAMAEAADISKAAAGRALDGMIDAITGAVKSNDTVSIIGFGTFALSEEIQIKASKSPKFKAGKAFKDAVN